MQPRLIRSLTESQALAHWADLYAAGKHRGKATPNLDQYLGLDTTWVEVEIPHAFYDADWNTPDWNLSSAQMERAERYAHTPGRLPPGIALYKGRRLIGKVRVFDGNHRAHAAFLRGDRGARFYMPKSDWERFLTSLT